MPEIKRPSRPDGIPEGGLGNSNVELNITLLSENCKQSENLTWQDYEVLMVSRYTQGGMSGATALHFAQREIAAIKDGQHWTKGKPTPNDPQAAMISALKYELTATEKERFNERAAIYEYDAHISRAEAEARAMAEILHHRNKPTTAPQSAADAPTVETHRNDPEIPPQQRYEGKDALAEYTRRGIRLMPCVTVEDNPKRYRPIVGKEKWDSTATADSKRITEYQSGALWPNMPINLFRFIPAEAGLICFDIDKGHSDGVDGEANFYRLLRARGYDPLPPLLRDLRTLSVKVETPSSGLHVYFSYTGSPIKKTKLAEGVEVFHIDPLTAAGSQKDNKAYILDGNIDNTPPLPAELFEIITDNGKPNQAPDNSSYRKESRLRGSDDKELLKARLLEYIKKKRITVTKKSGNEWINCPLHDDREPSMQINTSGRYAGILKCYSCGASLNVFGLARIMIGLPNGKKYFPQVAQEIKNTLGMGDK